MKKNYFFYLIIIAVALFGLFLRFNHYESVPPFEETKDEFIYPWVGMSLLKTGVPVSWSPYSYPTHYPLKAWGTSFSMVSPYIEKPFFYSLVVGSFAMLRGESEFTDVRLSTIRLIPLALSFISILGIGLFVKEFLDEKTAFLASLIYATVPTMVLGNRLSLTENMLIPLALLGWWLALKMVHKGSVLLLVTIGVLSGLSILTKQTGAVLPASIMLFFLYHKKYKDMLILGVFTVVFFAIHPLIAYYYDWTTYKVVSEQFRRALALGLPEAIYTLFRFPVIGHKEGIFLDGSMLLGYILLLAAPLTQTATAIKNKLLPALLFPLMYLCGITLLDGGVTWFGWHVFPLFPFLAILLAYAFMQIWEHTDVTKLLVIFMILASSSFRFLMLLLPKMTTDWQKPLGLVALLLVCIALIPFVRVQKVALFIIFSIYIAVNIFVVLQFPQLYPMRVQPV